MDQDLRIDKKSLPFVIVTSRIDVDPVTKVSHRVDVCDLSVFDAKLLAYIADRAQHRFTIGVPAPFPEHDLLRPIAEAIERGEPFELADGDQLVNDWDAAIAMDKALKLPAGTTQATVTDAPSLWSRMVDAWNVLTGKVTV